MKVVVWTGLTVLGPSTDCFKSYGSSENETTFTAHFWMVELLFVIINAWWLMTVTYVSMYFGSCKFVNGSMF